MPAKNRPLLILVDGSSYLYRAFHVPKLKGFTTSSGQPTGAIYGVVNMLRRLLNETQSRQLAVVFDAKGKTFRHELYKEYKANRPSMPEELQAQITPLHDIIHALGVKLISEPGVEADDVIGTLAVQAVKEGYRVLISTGDKDMAQLVNDYVTLVNTMSDTTMDINGVIKKFGVAPHQIVDYLALTGDKSDNVPGVPGVGAKTAAKWLNEYDSLEQLTESASAITGRVGEKLREHLDQLPLARQLTTVRCDVDVGIAIDDLQIQPQNLPRLRQLYTELEFKSWLKTLSMEETSEERQEVLKAEKKCNYEIILTEQDFHRWLQRLQQAKWVALDTETDSLDYMQASVVGLSFSVAPGEAAYLPFTHNYPGAPRQLDREKILAELEPLFNPGQAKIIGHNLKYDRSVLLNHDVHLDGIGHDTMLQSYVCNSVASRHDLDTLCERHLNHINIHFEDVAGKGRKQVTFDQVELEKAAEYAAEDADMTLRLHHIFWSELKQKSRQKALYLDVELPMLKVLSDIERHGVLVDAGQLAEQSAQLGVRISGIEKQAFELAGESFNLDSPKQIQEILFEKLNLPVIRKTPKGQPSTAEDVLQELARDYPLAGLLLEYRTLSKLKSTYTDKLPTLINPETRRIHTSYHQAVASTGRLSSSHPNLQNIPIRTEEGRCIRKAFIAPPGYQVLAADYSQIELRIMAHLSKDQKLCDAFVQDKDIHQATAAEVLGIAPDKVEPMQRRAAKAINFGLIYGMSAFGLARQLDITQTEARQYVDLYFERYPGVKKYMDDIRKQARVQGYVETLFGRRLYLPDINSKNARRRQYAERTAVNAPMQGTAADIIKRAMIAINDWIQHERHDCKMIMQVHDELVFEVRDDCTDLVKREVVRRMVSAADLSVPLVVDAALGTNWDEAH